jgi:hypothetical protein
MCQMKIAKVKSNYVSGKLYERYDNISNNFDEFKRISNVFTYLYIGNFNY